MMNSGYLKRLAGMAMVSALCLLPLRLCYGRLDSAQVPEALAGLAVPAHRYELQTVVYRFPGDPAMESYILTCYDPWEHPIRTITDEGAYIQRTYNFRGQLLRELTPASIPGAARICVTCTYDYAGRTLSRVVDYSGVSCTRTDYAWNADGTGTATAVTESGYPENQKRLVERQTLDQDGNVLTSEFQSAHTIQHRICAYDDYGNLVRQTTQMMDRQIVEEFRYTYDTKGNLLSRHSFMNGAAESASTYTYTEGRLTAAQTQYTDGSSSETAYTDVTA